MNREDIMYQFLKIIERKKRLTLLIINIFDYQNFTDYNYISRIIKVKKEVIIDIYDNISINRFNRYIFNFSHEKYNIKKNEENNVYITSICIENIENSNNKLIKLAYLFKNLNIDYAKTFLDQELIDILKKIINS